MDSITNKNSELEAANDELILACEAALRLRGLVNAITDPLALSGDKQIFRTQYMEIEKQIRAAILKANSIKK